MKKKLVTLLITGALMCTLLIGCGTFSEVLPSDDSMVDADTTDAVTADTPSETTTDAPSEDSVLEDEATNKGTADTPSEDSVLEADATDKGTVDTGADMTSTGKTTLTYCGHAGIKIVGKDGTVIYVDPSYYTGDYSDPADYVFVTHKHDDHLPYYKVTYTENGQLFMSEDMLHDGIYEKKDFGNVVVEAVPAGGNPNHDVKYCVGYLITIDGLTFYHAGDTSTLDTMSELAERNIDYAFYPIDGKYNMDAVEATAVAGIVGAKNNVPIHEFDDHQLDPSKPRKSDNFTPEGKLVLEYGETIVVGE